MVHVSNGLLRGRKLAIHAGLRLRFYAFCLLGKSRVFGEPLSESAVGGDNEAA